MANPAGTYIGKADLDSEFGESNIITWSNKENTADAADEAAIQDAIDFAEEYIENRFHNSKYAVPFVAKSGTLHTVKHWCVRLAGWKLYTARGMRDDDEDNKLAAIKEEVDAEISSTLAGIRGLKNAVLHTTAPSGPVAV